MGSGGNHGAQLGALLMAIGAVLASPPAAGATELRPGWTWSHTSLRPNVQGLLAVPGPGGRNRLVLLGEAYASPPVDESGYWYLMERAGDGFRQVWTSFGYEVRILGLTTAAAGGEIVVWTSAGIEVYSTGAAPVLLRSFPLPTDEILSVVVADVDGAPGRELLACDELDLHVIDFETGSLIETVYGLGGRRLDLGQADTDPALEIAIAGNRLGGYLVDGASRTVDWGLLAGFGLRGQLADIDGDGLDEVVYHGSSPARVGVANPRTSETLWERSDVSLIGAEVADLGGGPVLIGFRLDGDAVVALDALDGGLLWSAPVGEAPAANLAVGNLDGDPAPEVALASSGERTLLALDTASREVEAEELRLTGPFVSLSVGDVDGDADRELATAGQRRLNNWTFWSPLIFDVAARSVEYVGDPAGAADGVVEDAVLARLDADLQLEVCYGIRGFPGDSVQCLDGADHGVDFSGYLGDGEWMGALAAGDPDGDGRDDVFVASRTGRVLAFGGEPVGLRWSSQVVPDGGLPSLRLGEVDGSAGFEGVVCADNQVAAFDPLTGAVEAGPHTVSAARVVELMAGGPGGALRTIVGTALGVVAELDLATGQLAPPLATFPEAILALRSADLSRDGAADLAVGTAGRIVLLGGAEGTAIWQSPFLGHDAAASDSLYVVDLDGDPLPDLLASTGFGFAVFEAPAIELFADGFETGDASRWSAIVPLGGVGGAER